MACRQFENDLALFVEGDIPERRRARVEDHLRNCASCTAFVNSLRESQAALKSLRDPVDEDSLAALRQGVLREIAQEQERTFVPRRRLRWAMAGAAFVLVAIAVSVLHNRPALAPPLKPATPSAAPVASAPVAPRESRPPSLDSDTPVILVTDNPNIKLIWLMETGETDHEHQPGKS